MKTSRSFEGHARAATLLLLIGALSNDSLAAPGDVDLSFDPGSGVNDEVFAVAVQPDGKIIIGGQFTTVKGLARRGIARLNADGSGDSSFDPGSGADGSIRAAALQSDGKVLIGGSFVSVNGTNRLGLARFNADGSPDPGFNPPLGTNGEIGTLVVQSDGKILVGRLVGGEILRFNADGSHDGSFISEFAGQDVLALAVQADGTVLIGGVHIICEPDPETGQCNYINLYRVERLKPNGTRDTNFLSRVNGPVNSIAPKADGKILIGGAFFQVHGATRKGIARLNADGSLDASFDPGSAVNTAVYSVLPQPDGKVLVGTEVTLGTNGPGILRLEANGTLDVTFNPSARPNSSVYAVALQPDGKALIGGAFTKLSGSVCQRMARLDPSGGIDPGFDAGRGVNESVLSVAVQAGGKTLIGGQFTTVQQFDRPALARLHTDGNVDSTFDASLTGDPNFYFGNPFVKSVVVQSDGKVLIGGQFTGVHGTSRNRIARLHPDGNLDNSFNPGTGISGSDYPVVNSIAVQSDGKVFIGGSFTSVSGINRNGIARLNSNGSPDSSFNPNLASNHIINAVVLQSDGKVLVGGSFSTPVYDPNAEEFYPVYSHFLTRLNTNGTRDVDFDEAVGAIDPANPFRNSFIGATALQPDSRILVGGYFTTFKGASRNGLARLNADGTLDSSFNPGISGIGAHVDSIVLQPDGKILLGGYLGTFNGTVRNGIARLNADGSLDGSFNPGTGTDHVVSSLALQSDGNVLLGGHFTSVNGVVRPYVARLFGRDAAPTLNITGSNGFAVLSWPAAFGNFRLQESTNVSLANGWSAVAGTQSTNNGFISVTLPATGSRKFFRLSLP